MARRMKRSRGMGWLSGLGLSPERHRQSAKTNAEIALRTYGKIHDKVAGGECGSAFRNIVKAARFERAAQDHRVMGQSSDADPFTKISTKTIMENFERNCLVGGGLSGVRRRRSRR